MSQTIQVPRPIVEWLATLWFAVAAAAAIVAPASAQTDPPGRVGRIAELQGSVSWFDLTQGRWGDAVRNRPLTTGDRVSTGRDAAAEVRIGSTSLKLGEATELELLRLDDERVRIQLHRGSLAVRLRSREVAQETEFGTEEAWLRPSRGGLYRLDRQDETTHAASWRGELAVVDDGAVVVEAGRRVQLWREGPNRELRHRYTAVVDDAFAARVLREDRDDERSASAAYVSPETTGFEDLDRHGRWETHPDYGPIWTPMAVQPGWAPYRHGRWEWIGPWGWTWIDDAPWGFAPFHYGRWVSWRGRWCWVPGPYVVRPIYSPALVAWIDGPSVGIGIRFGGPTLSWVPLAPWDTYHPHYRVSPGYRDRINTPDHRRWRPPPSRREGSPGYGNQGVPDAVTVVPRDVLRPGPGELRDGWDGSRPAPSPGGSGGHRRVGDPAAPGTVNRVDPIAPRTLHDREAREREARERESRERQAREREAREREARDRETRERESRERQAREREAREREAREREAREREAREREARNRAGPPLPPPVLTPPTPLRREPLPAATQPTTPHRPAVADEPRQPQRERDKEPKREDTRAKPGDTRGMIQ